MTPEERQLISGLFDRIRSHGSPAKDREAEDLIYQSVRGFPDAPYMLVQSVLVQEHALQEAAKRIQDLEAQVRSLQADGPPRAAAASGSFLGGLFGSGRPASDPGSTSVPPIGSRAAPPAEAERPPVWGSSQPPPLQQQPPMQPPPGGSPGGSFMRTAAFTAAGVAGGMLAAGAIRNMLGGSPAAAAQHTPPAAAADTQARAEQMEGSGERERNVQDASYDNEDDGWGGASADDSYGDDV